MTQFVLMLAMLVTPVDGETDPNPNGPTFRECLDAATETCDRAQSIHTTCSVDFDWNDGSCSFCCMDISGACDHCSGPTNQPNDDDTASHGWVDGIPVHATSLPPDDESLLWFGPHRYVVAIPSLSGGLEALAYVDGQMYFVQGPRALVIARALVAN